MTELGVVVTGATGRMGRALLECIAATDGIVLCAATARSGHPRIGDDVGDITGMGASGVLLQDRLSAVFAQSGIAQCEVVIDFTTPQATVAHAEVCRAAGRAMVIGTTGLDAGQWRQLEAAASDIAIVCAPNMSIGVNAMLRLLEMAAHLLGEDVDIEIFEAHHRHKVDAPSGTALAMGEAVTRRLSRGVAGDGVSADHGRGGPQARRGIGFQSLRSGDIVGEHTALFAGAGERLEIVHKTGSRANFASGALRAARWLRGRSPGLYDMQDVLRI